MTDETKTTLELYTETEFEVRFHDCDPLGIVWHGNYARYFELGRDNFAQKFNLDFVNIFHQHGFSTPLISFNMDFKKPLTYRDKAVVRVTFCPTDSAKLVFKYLIYKTANKEKICTGSTTQVFVNREEKMLSLIIPPFFKSWKSKQGL